MTSEPILKEGKNCWRKVQADQGAFLIDGCDYFRAFRSALIQARKQVVILGWDFNSQVLLERDGRDDGFPSQLGAFLLALLESRPDLHFYVLLWDFSVIYTMEREWNTFSTPEWESHPNMHLVRDAQLPVGASHHQKVVLVDNALAFCGGLDLSVLRWDTKEHKVEDPRRVDPDGKPYDPFHDLQLCVTGPAARALGDLCAGRWQRATGKNLPRIEDPELPVPWPEGVGVDFENKTVGISRTYAAFEPHPAVYEIEQLHIDIIQAARDFLYFENQYFSSHRLAMALMERLREKDGPEVIIVLTQDTGGWLEENTMGMLRDRLFELLIEADEHGRLRVLYPKAVDGNNEAQVFIHAKVFIADDRWVKIGSSNLSNRSMRVDSEVDLTLEESEHCDWIKHFRYKLVSTHYDMDQEEFASAVEKHARFTDALDAMKSDHSHSLHLFRINVATDWQRQLTDSQLLDPDEPIDPAQLIQSTLPRETRPDIMQRIRVISLLALCSLAVALLFKWSAEFDGTSLQATLKSLQSSPGSPIILTGIFFLSGLACVPINPILVTCVVFFGPWTALGCGLVGTHASALAGFWLGSVFGKPLIHKLGSKKIDHINHILGKRGVGSVALIRLLPVAPFIVVNLVAGASRLPFRVFNLGTLAGMIPGMSILVFMTRQLESTIREPSWVNISALFLVLILVVTAVLFIRKRMGKQSRSS